MLDISCDNANIVKSKAQRLQHTLICLYLFTSLVIKGFNVLLKNHKSNFLKLGLPLLSVLLIQGCSLKSDKDKVVADVRAYNIEYDVKNIPTYELCKESYKPTRSESLLLATKELSLRRSLGSTIDCEAIRQRGF